MEWGNNMKQRISIQFQLRKDRKQSCFSGPARPPPKLRDVLKDSKTGKGAKSRKNGSIDFNNLYQNVVLIVSIMLLSSISATLFGHFLPTDQLEHPWTPWSIQAAKPSWTEKDLSTVMEKLLKAQVHFFPMPGWERFEYQTFMVWRAILLKLQFLNSKRLSCFRSAWKFHTRIMCRRGIQRTRYSSYVIIGDMFHGRSGRCLIPQITGFPELRDAVRSTVGQVTFYWMDRKVGFTNLRNQKIKMTVMNHFYERNRLKTDCSWYRFRLFLFFFGQPPNGFEFDASAGACGSERPPSGGWAEGFRRRDPGSSEVQGGLGGVESRLTLKGWEKMAMAKHQQLLNIKWLLNSMTFQSCSTHDYSLQICLKIQMYGQKRCWVTSHIGNIPGASKAHDRDAPGASQAAMGGDPRHGDDSRSAVPGGPCAGP